jgi:hypothetical protein
MVIQSGHETNPISAIIWDFALLCIAIVLFFGAAGTYYKTLLIMKEELDPNSLEYRMWVGEKYKKEQLALLKFILEV